MPAACLVLGAEDHLVVRRAAGIIGKQFSFGSTAMSAITARSARQHLADHIVQLIHLSARSPMAWKRPPA